MSGGSHNYLCYKDVEEIIYETEELECMRDTLIKYGYEDIAKDTQRLVEYIKSAKVRIETLNDLLKPVFKAIEWYESGDTSKESMNEILESYRMRHGE